MARGFTLIEMIVAVSVLMILVTVAAPSLTQTVETRRLVNAANELQQLFIQAKSHTVMRNEPVYIHVVTLRDEWCVVAGTSRIPPADCSVPEITDWPFALSHGQVALQVTGTHLVSLDPVRGSFGENGSLNLSLGASNVLSVKYWQNGRVRVCSQGGDYYGFHQC